ncbi:SRPBCC family protein [Albimonas sp. CAU 1670]|uniref:SRPBCC family protein n=1 Tax=Albimonas sp. CAU 1670 TaxID=3032599 RepID=UPI0023DB0EFF|nr:SRPBCC family protein [Albimonas sp. CAU 1670]MDF2231140.1 SRPBCC family protein [Albimonas sp. CAU 1670]
MRVVELRHDYPVSPDRLWAMVTDYEALAESVAGLIAFEGLPEGQVRPGQVVEVQTSLFGRLPPRPYRMEVIEHDAGARRLRSREHGMGVRRWEHEMAVEPIPGGARLNERVEIDAGLATPLFAAWARFMYRARHAPRLRMLEAGRF